MKLERNAPKIRSRCFEIRLWHRDRWWIGINAYEPESKQKSIFQDESNPTKVARARSTSKQMIACVFGRTGYVAIVPLEQRRSVNSEWYTTICLPESSKKLGKPKAKGGLLSTTTMRAPTHRLKRLHFWALKTSIWWVIRRIVLTWHRVTLFYSRYVKNSTIGSNACKSVEILMGNILKNNKAIFDD